MRRTISGISPLSSPRVLGLLCVAVTIAVSMACGEGGVSNPAAPSATNGASLTATSEGEGAVTVGDLARQPKTEVCHMKNRGDFKLKSVPDRQVSRHLAHGDALVGDLVPGSTTMVFDETCTPVPVVPTNFVVSQTQVDFVTQFNQAPPNPITFVFVGLPTNPVGPGSLTVSGAIGDFAPGATESFGVSADNGLINFGILYNNDPTDDIFDNASFGDSGVGSTTTGAMPATALIDLATLSTLVADGSIDVLVQFGATVGDRPEESLTLTLQYPIP